MLNRIIERNGDGRSASKRDRQSKFPGRNGGGSLLNMMGDILQQNNLPQDGRQSAGNGQSADGQGSFLNELGAASINAQRQRDLAQTAQRVEQELRLADEDYFPAAKPPSDIPPGADYHRQPSPAPAYQPHGRDHHHPHAIPAYPQHHRGAATQVNDSYARPQDGAPHYGTQHQQPPRQELGPATPDIYVEQQLDLLSEKLEGVRSRHQRNVIPPAPSHPAPHHPATGALPRTYPPISQTGGGGGGIVENPFSIGNMLSAALRTWKWIVIGTIAGMAVGAVYAVSLPNEFESIADILIEPRGIKVLDDTVAPNSLNSEATVAYAESQLSIIRSRSVLDPVIKELKLDEDPEFIGELDTPSGIMDFLGLGGGSDAKSGSNREIARQHLLENMWISRTNQTFVISVGVQTRVPEKSRDIANAIAQSYIKDESGAQSSAARNASEDLAGQLPALRQRVEDSEKEVEQHKRENNLVSLGDQSVNQAQLARLTDQMAIAMVQTGDLRVRAQIAENADLSNVILGSLPSSLNSPELKRLRTQYSSVQTGIKRLAVKLGAKHPKRIAAQAELSGIQDAMRAEISRVVRSADEEYSRAKAREAELNEQIQIQEKKLSAESGATIKLRELELKAKSDRALYEKFFARFRETGELENIRSESARLLSPAIAPIQKIGPNRKFVVATSGFFGGGLFGFLALLPFVISGMRQLLGEMMHPTSPAQQQRQSMPVSAPVHHPQDGDLYSTQVANNGHHGQPFYSDWKQHG